VAGVEVCQKKARLAQEALIIEIISLSISAILFVAIPSALRAAEDF
jgi:hypothetical protein